MEILTLALTIFIPLVVFIELFMYARRIIVQPERPTVKKRAKNLSAARYHASAPGIVRSEKFSDVLTLHRIISFIPVVNDLEKFRKQANAQYPLSVFILGSALAIVTGFVAILQINLNNGLATLAALVLGAIPWIYLYARKNARMKKFQKQ
ncbi:MAG: hypothetical protein R6X11_01185, partial [Desulfonatronovibrio sp.]